jgi:hypothetical protein
MRRFRTFPFFPQNGRFDPFRLFTTGSLQPDRACVGAVCAFAGWADRPKRCTPGCIEPGPLALGAECGSKAQEASSLLLQRGVSLDINPIGSSCRLMAGQTIHLEICRRGF